ncbi:RNA polymerase sigma factor [Pontibacter actiniarum]|uniref:RNA polymerase subunit sigma-70 n=1 Tax=Pontibacter actiniarum TaxID=323450 RepID=A0A1X9YNX7_9BACT|nr:sigma-70 family RNA polymerase sigma factor [Pontibacter actiniarum]ARS34565.1 hypothetical protein CA264_03400 [Pontibacter actiniarum]
MSGTKFDGEGEQYLIEALQQGNREVLGQLYDAYAPVMLGVISRIVEDAEVAEEVLQETFVAVWSRIEVYDYSRNRFLTWALAIARGMALEAVKAGKCNSLKKAAAKPAPEGAQAGKPQNQGESPLCHLEPQERAVLELIYLKGRSCPEAAAALGITEQKLRQTLQKAFIHLKAGKPA